MFTRVLCFLLSTLCTAITLAQNSNADCSSALFLCDKKSLVISALPDAGTQIESPQMSCLEKPFTETNALWLRFKIEKPGTLAFILSPHETQNDLDFVLYRTQPEADCNTPLEALRCMAAGPNLGESDSGTDNCTGDTGLKEGATETHQNSGCRSGQGNFLKLVEAATGESYLLWINNFRNKGGLDITWTGTATFRPDPILCPSVSDLDDSDAAAALRFSDPYPNPVNDRLLLNADSPTALSGRYEVFRSDGSLVLQLPCSLPAGTSVLEIPAENLTAGVKVEYGMVAQVPPLAPLTPNTLPLLPSLGQTTSIAPSQAILSE